MEQRGLEVGPLPVTSQSGPGQMRTPVVSLAFGRQEAPAVVVERNSANCLRACLTVDSHGPAPRAPGGCHDALDVHQHLDVGNLKLTDLHQEVAVAVIEELLG